MKFHANYVATAVSGDYYGAYFDSVKDLSSFEEYSLDKILESEMDTSPHLHLQRQFEFPDDGVCGINTHDKRYFGHWRIRIAKFSREGLTLELLRPVNRIIEVTFSIANEEFIETESVLKIISDEKPLPYD
jgi:hypothetical protein